MICSDFKFKLNFVSWALRQPLNWSIAKYNGNQSSNRRHFSLLINSYSRLGNWIAYGQRSEIPLQQINLRYNSQTRIHMKAHNNFTPPAIFHCVSTNDWLILKCIKTQFYHFCNPNYFKEKKENNLSDR